MPTKTKRLPTAKHGDLRVWWIPQVPMKSFNVPVANLVEARLLMNVLAEYDAFQFDNNIKPDYSNAGGLSVFDTTDKHDGPDGSWVDWYSEDGDEIDNYTIKQLRENPPTWQDQN